MYLVSRPKPLSESQSQELANEGAISFPPGYLVFLRRFGEGTYRGWMNVHFPDSEVLKPFAGYGLWEHDADSPITEEQIGECVAIGTTTDGDFLAVHPGTFALLWLPRHDDRIQAISLQANGREEDESYAKIMDEIYLRTYGSSQEGAVYYEPSSDSRGHLFLHLSPENGQHTLPELAGVCRAEFRPDLSMETEYACHLFYRQLGGYIRFNYAYGREVAIFYEQDADAGKAFAQLEQWLLSNGCKII
ncbi:hypothetical protein DFP94_10854 [Fontibacillus phaseoli]|uniref:SUKH superfamily protein n=1 Tax=Fontibacillus phaseoli TaxID=1416533 RepID=A0A369B8Q4_9BACL|nr:hypothetical protein [Fontibacillus phaseoli]RCX17695.1 hypothetical protein DFP94_10854 [Fontibacillus phaseoli]